MEARFAAPAVAASALAPAAVLPNRPCCSTKARIRLQIITSLQDRRVAGAGERGGVLRGESSAAAGDDRALWRGAARAIGADWNRDLGTARAQRLIEQRVETVHVLTELHLAV